MSETPSKPGPLPADQTHVSTLSIQPPPIAYAPPVPPPPSAGPSPLSPEHLAQLAAAKKRETKVRRARSVATFDAYTTAVFGVVALASGLLSWRSPDALLIGLALGFATFNSFRGLHLLRQNDFRAPTVLALNQLFIAVSITLYALWQIHAAPEQTKTLTEGLDPEMKQMMSGYTVLVSNIYFYVYAAVIAATWVAQGFAALYYFTRRSHLREYIESTPQWIHDLQRSQR